MIYHKGRWLIAPEIKALLDKLEDMNEELRSEADRVLRENTVLKEKQESAERQIAEYKRLLKAAVEDFRISATMLDDGHGHCTAEIGCDECVLGGGNLADDCQWRYEAEALALIGGKVRKMAIQKIEAYRCTYCGKLMLSPEMHEFECRYEPKARTCTTCGFENELIRTREDGLHGACYCPRAEKVFSYPCAKYCPDYKRSPDFKEI